LGGPATEMSSVEAPQGQGPSISRRESPNHRTGAAQQNAVCDQRMVGGGTIGKVACPEEAGVGSGGLEGREEDRLSIWDFSQTWANAGKERTKEANA